MPHQNASGGWVLGNPNGNAAIEILPLFSSTDPFLFDRAIESAREWLTGQRTYNDQIAFMGWTSAKFLPDMPAGWIGIVGRAQDICIIFQWEKRYSPTDALREIEGVEKVLPVFLATALQTAAAAVDRKIDETLIAGAVHYAALAGSSIPTFHHPSFSSRSDLEHLVESSPLVDLLGNAVPGISSATDYARLLALLGKRFFDEKWYSAKLSISGDETTYLHYFERLLRAATSYLCMSNPPTLTISGVLLRIRFNLGTLKGDQSIKEFSGHSSIEMACLLYDNFHQSHPPADVLRAFFPEGSLDTSSYAKATVVFDMLNSTFDHPAAIHLAESLIEEANRDAAYSPQGMYRVILPHDLPLTMAGVTDLRVYFYLNTIWIQLLFPDPCPLLLPWNPKEYKEEHYPSSFNLTMAALWRDFHCSPTESFPDEKDDSVPPSPSSEDIPPPMQRSAKNESVRLLPVAHHGRHSWGYRSERTEIIRRRHLVGAFRRHLPYGWTRRPNALDLASEYGIVLPDDKYTIVLPHARGGRPGDFVSPSNPPVVKSRGLAALFAFTNFMEANKKE